MKNLGWDKEIKKAPMLSRGFGLSELKRITF
jgi:hypothetical protein